MLNRTLKQVTAYVLTLVLLIGMLPTFNLWAKAAASDETDEAVIDTEIPANEEEQGSETEEQENELMLLNNEVTGPYDVDGSCYATLTDAIVAAQVSGSSGQINLVDDAELTEGDFVIPSGVSLVVPYAADKTTIQNGASETNPYANSETTEDANGPWGDPYLTPASESTCTYLLTIGRNVTITVANGGLLVVGGVISGESGGFSGQTYGAYSMIDLDGTIIVENGGVLSCCGYIVGSGSIIVENGGEVYEPFVICDYNGGLYTVVAYKKSDPVSPFNRYAMFNIQVDMILEYGAVLQGYVSLFTGAISQSGITLEAQHNQSISCIIGPDGTSALLNTDGAELLLEYSGGEISGLEEVGHTHITVKSGTVAYGELNLTVKVAGGSYDVTTKTIDFPVPYNFSFEFKSGTTAEIPGERALRMLPGTEIHIAKGAEMVVNGSLALYDGLNNSGFLSAPSPVTVYPTPDTLQEAGYSARARLIVDGTLYLNGTFSGLVESSGVTGIIKTGTKPTFGGVYADGLKSTDTYSDVLKSKYDNYTCQTIGARLWNGSELVDLVANENYYAYKSSNGYTATGFDYTVSDGTENSITFATPEETDGAWITDGTITYVYDGQEYPVGSFEPGMAISVSAPANITAPEGYELTWDEAPTTMGRQNYVLEGIITPVEYHIYYNLNNGKLPAGISNPTTYTIEDTFTLPTPNRGGYAFVGWTGSNGDTPEVAVTVEAGTTGTLTYTAHWEVEGYGVTFDANGGSFADGVTEQVVPVNYNTPVASPGTSPAREGYTFGGWYTDADCSEGKEYSFSAPVTESFTLYAKWTINSYTIRFYQNYGDNSLVGSIPANYGVTVDEDDFPADPVRDNYTFTGWYTTAAGNGEAVTSVTMPANNIDLYAGWAEKAMTVKFLANGGEGEMEDQTIKYSGSLVQLNENTFTRTGYDFAGWNTAADGNGTTYSEVFGSEGDLTLYAQWTAKVCTVVLKDGETQFAIGYPRVDQNYGSGFSNGVLPTPTKSGHNFAGWYTAAEGGDQVLSGTTVEYSEEVIYLYAQWTTGSYTVTWDANGGAFADGDTNKTATYAYGGTIEALADIPSRDGYTFDGWSGYTAGATMGSSNVVYTAQWKVKTYTVTLDANGGVVNGSAATEITVEHGGVYPYLPYPTYEGHGFLGWFFSETDETPVEQGDAVSLTEDVTLIAKWDANLYTIYYRDTDYITTLHSDSYAAGETIKAYTPTKTGYTFGGWKTMDGQVWTPGMMPSEDVYVYVISWSKNTYTVTWDANTGSFADGSETFEKTYSYDAAIAVPANPTKEGYTFDGWEGYTAGDKMGAEDVTYTAQWSVNSYKVTWTVDGKTTEETYAYGAKINKPADPTKTGYTFAGWQDANGNEPTTMPAGDVTYIAQWTANNYTITWVDEDGRVLETDENVAYGTLPTFDGAPPIKETTAQYSYSFTGWTPEIKAADADAVYTAVYAETPVTYTATFLGNGGTLSDGSDTQTINVAYGQSISVPAFTRTGYNFVGWLDEEGNAATVPTKMPASNVTYKADWSAKSYTIYFISGEGTAVSPITGDYDSAIETAPTSTREGYTLTAWCSDSGLTNAVSFPYTIQGGTTLYAKWTVNNYNVTFNANGGSFADGSSSKTVSVTYGEAITVPDAPTKAHFTFAGWSPALPGTMPARDLSVNAQWAAKRVTISFVTNCDSAVDPIEGNSGDSVMLPNIADKKPGYRFDGWTVNGEIVTSTSMPDENVVYTAKWTSYLDLLVDIDAAGFEDADTLALARGYYDLMQKDETLLAEYKANYDAHHTAIRAAILDQLEKSVVVGAENIENQGLLVIDGVKVATIYVDEETRTIDVCIEAEDTPAINLVGPAFLPELLNNPDIGSVRFEELYNAQYSKDLYQYGPIDANAQTDLMLLVAFTALRDEAGVTTGDDSDYNNFFAWLDTSITVGEMDEETVHITVLVDTVEGFEFGVNEREIPYTLNFYNRNRTITWNVDGVETTSDSKVGETIETPADPSKEGYTFAGWEGYTAGDKMGTTDVTYTAKWTVNSYKVTWDVDGEKTEETYAYGAAIEVPSNPTKTGYIFSGWQDANGNAPSTMPAEDVTYTAKWTTNSYTVTWVLDGEKTEETYAYGATIEAPAAPIKEGHTFAGWEGYTAGDKMGAANVTYTAKWTVNNYKVTWVVDGEKTEVNYAYGAKITVPTAPTKPGHGFAGWGATIPATMPANDLTFTAQWTVGEYTVTWVADSTTYASYKYGDTIKVPADPTKTGYTFTGWDAEIPATMPANDLTFTAQWTVNNYKVTWVVDGEKTEQTYAYGVELQAPANPAKEGYTFVGWEGYTPGDKMGAANVTYTAQWSVNSYKVTWTVDGKTTEETYAYGAKINKLADPTKTGYTFAGWGATVPATMPANDLAFTAQWTTNGYAITWVVDGNETIETYAYGAKISKPVDPTKEGHTFAGWLDEDGKATTIPSTMPAENLTITANWTVNEYTVTWNVDGKTSTEKYKYGVELDAPADPAKVGYTFVGWDGYTEGDTMGAANVTYTAKWTVNNYKVTWVVDGEKTEVSYAYGAVITAPASPTKTGYTFAGWNGYTEGTKMGTTNLTYTAQWTVNKYTITWIVDGVTYKTDTYAYGDAITAPVPSKAGYIFGGWTPAVADTMPAQDLSYTAAWNVAGDTAYTVYHYQQKLDGTGYDLKDTEPLTGATESEVFAKWKTYTGFVANTELSTDKGVITGDGELALNLYYDRKTYTVTWITKESVKQTYRYGAALTPPDASYNTDNATYTFTGWTETLVSPVTTDAIYTAKYSVSYDAVIVGSGVTYRTLEIALANAKSGEIVRLEKDAVLTANATVPAGVTLLLPCKDNDQGYEKKETGYMMNPDGTSSAGSTGVGPYAKLYRTLTIPEGKTLKVNGTVMVNSVSGRPSAGGTDQDVTGGYAQILLDGEIIVNNGGKLDSFGYVKGDGRITAEKGAAVGDLYIVRNWRGGHQALTMFNNNVYPMNEYDCHNIEADILIKYGATYDGMVKMFATMPGASQGAFYHTRFPQVDVNNGLIRLVNKDGYVLRTYENGREVYTISGGAKFAESTLTLLGVTQSTSDFVYPIDGDIDFVLKDGTYTFVNNYKFLPGSTMTAKRNAHVVIDNPEVIVAFYKEFKDKPNTANTQYPSDRPQAILTLETGSTFTNGGTFAGKIVTGEANIMVKQGSYVDPGELAGTTLDDITYYTPVWSAAIKEANGYYGDVPSGEKPYVTVNVALEIERTGYTWRLGETAKGEEYNSIIWLSGEGLTATAQATATSSSVSAKVKVYNTYTTKKTVNAYVAAYDADGQMVGLQVVNNWTIAANATNGVTKTVTVTVRNADHIRVFLLDSNMVPLAGKAYAKVQ